MNLRLRQMRMLNVDLFRAPPMRLTVHYNLRDLRARPANPSHPRRIDLNLSESYGSQSEAPAASIALR